MRKLSFEELGGRSVLEAISKSFYDKVYKHPWLGKFFQDVPQDHQESQQVDFLQQSMGGAPKYCGRAPASAHMHINVSDALFELRDALLLEAFKENKASPELITRWNKI